jgi:hypothetical protein
MRCVDIMFNVQVDGIIYGTFFALHSRRFEYLIVFGDGDRVLAE